jgi:hypothetical protein
MQLLAANSRRGCHFVYDGKKEDRMVRTNKHFGVGLILLLIAAASVRSIGGQGPIHSITGSGEVEEEGVKFRTTIAAHQRANGDVWGTVVINLDLSVFDITPLITFRQDVTCVDVAGNSAWVGGVVTQSNNEDIIPVGTTTVTLVRDLGGNGEDIMHGEPFPSDVTCEDRPAVPETVVTKGNYKVR